MSFSASHPWTWVAGRETGHPRLGRRRGVVSDTDHLHKQLYQSIAAAGTWDPTQVSDAFQHGAVFNFDFAKDGALLVAACERKSLLLFDPLSHKHITSVHNAHSDCVNFVRFLDTRVFATCSDDTQVALWDVRNLKTRMRTLEGHSNWVKNIEYAHDKGLLVTSGFDGSIYAWNINSYSEDESTSFHRVFHMSGLMRMQLTPEADKLVIATAAGYLMVIHDLDILAVGADLHGFKPNMYRLMQKTYTPMRQGYSYNHLFNKRRRRNRVEFVSDFPLGNDAEVIASLQIHPNGAYVLSRNTSSDDNSEWTCVHRISSDKSDDDEPLDRCPNCDRRFIEEDPVPNFPQSSHLVDYHDIDSVSERESVEEDQIIPLASPSRAVISPSPLSVRNRAFSSSSSVTLSASSNDGRDRSPLLISVGDFPSLAPSPLPLSNDDELNRREMRREASEREPRSAGEYENEVEEPMDATTSPSPYPHATRLTVGGPGIITDIPPSNDDGIGDAADGAVRDVTNDGYLEDESVETTDATLSTLPTSSLISSSNDNGEGMSYSFVVASPASEDSSSSSSSSSHSSSSASSRPDPTSPTQRPHSPMDLIATPAEANGAESSEDASLTAAVAELTAGISDPRDAEAMARSLRRVLTDRADNIAAAAFINSVEEAVAARTVPVSRHHIDSDASRSIHSGRRAGRLLPRVVIRRANGQRLTVVRRNRANQPRSSRSPMVSRSRSASSSQQNYPPTLRRLPQREEDRLFHGQGHSQSNSNATQPTSSRVDDSGDAPSAPFDPEAALDTDAVSTSSIDGIAVSAAASQPRPAALYVPSPRRGPSISDWDSEAGVPPALEDFVLSMRRGFNPHPSSSSSALCTCIDTPASSNEASLDASQKLIHTNTPRLAFYEEESNVGRGFIKELCFSSDGRLVCSPFGYGARLMSFNGACSDLRDIPSYSSSSSSTSTWQPQIARPLHSVSTLASHSNTVVCTKWSPTHCLFASACLNGKVVFYNPVF